MHFSSIRRPVAQYSLSSFLRQWPCRILCCKVFAIGALVNLLLFQYNLLSILTPITAHGSSDHASIEAQSWRDEVPWNTSIHSLEILQGTLKTMQSHIFWNGTYWPSTIQWIGAVMNTLVIAADHSFADVLKNIDDGARGSSNLSSELQQDIQQYWEDAEAYYGSEDTAQIFGAAYDDAQWVVLEWLEAIKFVKTNNIYANSSLRERDIANFAHRAHIFYNIVKDQFNTSYCQGGLTWNPSLAPYKNAITNELFLSSSIAMYLYFPGDNNTDPYPSKKYEMLANTTLPPLQPLIAHDPTFLANAKEEWTWFQTHNFTNAQGLIVDGFHISANQTTCDERNEMVYTYNQGVLLSGLRGLWEATGDVSYLSSGYGFINTTIRATGWSAMNSSESVGWSGLGRNGIMEDYCDAPANCSQDAQVFKGIYFQHLDQFCEPLPTSIPLVYNLTYTASGPLALRHELICQSYIPWIHHNANAALRTRNASDVIGGWWGAPLLNRTQQPSPEMAQPLPIGSWDVWNRPLVLRNAPWTCKYGKHGCGRRGSVNRYFRQGAQIALGRMGETRRTLRRHNQTGDPNDDGRGRTVETQASGLGVVKAAFDFALRRGKR